MAAGGDNGNCLARDLARGGRWENFRRGGRCPSRAINFNYFPDIFALGAPDESSIEILSEFTPFARYCCCLVPAGRVESLCGSVRLDDKDSQLAGAIRGKRRSRRQQAVSI